MTNMRVEDLQEGLRRLLAVQTGDEEPTRLERVQLRKPQEWDDDDWEFANQRGLVPSNLQPEYQRRVIERRHQAELASLNGEDVPPNFGGNLFTGTATMPQSVGGQGLNQTTVSGQPIDPEERQRQIEVEIERLKQEQERLSEAVGSSEDEDPEAQYRSRTVSALQSEISTRNAGRSEEDAIEPDSQRKDDLIAALMEDDELSSQRAAEPTE